jgi:hypothetical protein
MFEFFGADTTNYKSDCYIAKKIKTVEDEYGNQIEVYAKPKPYSFNIQPVTSSSEVQAFGEISPKMKKALVSKAMYEKEFDEFDRAYLDGATPNGEVDNGDNANYRIYSIQPQNVGMMIYFLKIVKGEK